MKLLLYLHGWLAVEDGEGVELGVELVPQARVPLLREVRGDELRLMTQDHRASHVQVRLEAKQQQEADDQPEGEQ